MKARSGGSTFPQVTTHAPGSRRSRRAGTLAVLLVALSVLATAPPTVPPALGAVITDEAAGGGSAVTVYGKAQGFEDFSGLAVTVSQTRSLANQAVTVSWTGATPTPQRPLGVDYLQLMQCWGDPFDATDPLGLRFRETCQFGMNLEVPNRPGSEGGFLNTSNLAGRRSLEWSVPADYPTKDPDENVLPTGSRMVPFRTVSGESSRNGSPGSAYEDVPVPNSPGVTRQETDVDVLREYFSEASTNEYPYAVTAADGTGQAVFEVQNANLQRDLGCGASYAVSGQTRPSRPCSLVIVPRGHRHPYTGEDVSRSGSVHGSPFTPALWQHRIVVPLEFQPVGEPCSGGPTPRRINGAEVAAPALTSWRPTVCANAGPNFAYTVVGDFEASAQLLSRSDSAPGLVFSADPVTTIPSDPPVVHAPVTVSSIVIATNIDVNLVNPNETSVPIPPEVAAQRGLALGDLKLTPRLLAKLLTQSYLLDAKTGVPAQNPQSIRYDKEFLTLNPLFRYWDAQKSATLNGLMVSYGNTAAARELWRWIWSDQEAQAWLTGNPDEDGMLINSNYSGAFTDGLPGSFPKLDSACTSETDPAGEEHTHCGIDLRPYMTSMGESAMQTLRSDVKGISSYFNRLSTSTNYGYEPIPRQSVGRRFAMSVTDSASAGRYGLLTAQLCKPRRDSILTLLPPDDCRGATTGAMTAAAATAVLRPPNVPGVGGVRVIDPIKAWAAPGAYPLTTITYAVGDTTDPADARRDYAKLLRYAAGSGQQSGPNVGQLPPGYVPLPADLREQTMVAADRLEHAVAPTTAAPTPTATAAATTAPAVPAVPPNPGNPPSPGATPPATQPPAQRVAQSTPGSPLGNVRYLLIAVLLVGLVGGVAGPILQRLATRGAAPPGGAK